MVVLCHGRRKDLIQVVWWWPLPSTQLIVWPKNMVLHGKTTQDVKIEKADKVKHEKSDKAGEFDDEDWIIWYSLDIGYLDMSWQEWSHGERWGEMPVRFRAPPFLHPQEKKVKKDKKAEPWWRQCWLNCDFLNPWFRRRSTRRTRNTRSISTGTTSSWAATRQALLIWSESPEIRFPCQIEGSF